MALSVSGGKGNSGNVETEATHFGGTNKNGDSVLTYGTCPKKGPGMDWVSKLSLKKVATLAAMLAGTFGIERPKGLVLIPRNAIKSEYKSVDLKSQDSLDDPRVLDAIDMLKGEGCDVSAIENHIASFTEAPNEDEVEVEDEDEVEDEASVEASVEADVLA